MTVAEGLALGVLATWGLASIIGQLQNRFAAKLRVLDIFGLIPGWSFFAPRPITHDLHLLYRDRSAGQRLSPWKEISTAKSTTILSLLWNPKRRYNKALFDVVRHLANEAQLHDDGLQPIQLSVPYIVILNFVTHLPHDPEAVETQFLLMRGRVGEEDDIQPVVVSSLHALEA